MSDIFDPIAWAVARRLGGGNGSGGGVAIKNQDKTITENGTYKADSGYTGLGTVNVNVPVPSGTIDITENGNYDVTNFATALVEVAAVQAGGKVCTGTLVPESDVTPASFGVDLSELGDMPDFFIVYEEPSSKILYSDNRGLWCLVQKLTSKTPGGSGFFDLSVDEFIFGYNAGSSKYYAPLVYLNATASKPPSAISSWVSVANPNVKALAGHIYRYYGFLWR